MKQYCVAAIAASLLTVPAFAQSDTDAAAGVTLRTPAGIQQVVADPGYYGGDAGEAFWGSARNLAGNHNLWGFDASGVATGGVVDTVASSQGSAWGYRDGATDHVGGMYWGWETGLAHHANDGSGGVEVVAGGAPGGVGTWRALAVDPTGGSIGSIWTQSFATGSAEVDLAGFGLLNSFPNNGSSAYGFAFDSTDGNIWVHTTGGEVVKMNTMDGSLTGAGWSNGFANLAAQGGLSGLHDGSGDVYALSQGTPDEAGVYDTSGTLTGPWDLQGQTGSNGHLGIAAVVSGGPNFAGKLDCPIGGGRATLSLSGGTASGPVGIVASTNGSGLTIPVGPCAGTVIATAPPFLPGFPVSTSFDANGDLSLSGNVPAGLCGVISVSAVDLTTCDVVDLP